MLNFTAIDFETANSKRASVCQIGLTRVVDGEITRTVSAMVSPPPGYSEFHQRNIQVHGIRPADVVGALTWEETLEKMLDFAEGTPLIGHNVSFEKSVVREACNATGITEPQLLWGCTLKMARTLLPGHPTYSLAKLSDALGLEGFGHHDAGEDAAASARLALYTARKLGISSTYELFA